MKQNIINSARFFLILVASLLMYSSPAFSDEINQSKRSEQKNTSIEGDIFIVTRGQQVIKLPLVKISVVSENQLNNYLKNRKAALTELRNELIPEIIQTKQEILKYKKEVDDAKKTGEDIHSPTSDFAHYYRVSESNLEVATEKLLRLERKSTFGNSYQEFFDGIDSSVPTIFSTKSDSEGKFVLNANFKGRVAIIAKSSRFIGELDERYLWVIWLKNGAKKISLSVDNMIGTNCDECVEPK
ncbi:hypothetical protein ACFFKC_05850 [Pseudoduganella danionis]|uniref:DUF3450 family protein n=1 Tax=Pseudoduganella danionis TaxID=1890295 RepID=A0ABW9SVA4_9BURK|nr:hypothetical protein [Pseudoduganella danionis]MTW34274.1 hypothetical protein [Pseudoduganella danionis]